MSDQTTQPAIPPEIDAAFQTFNAAVGAFMDAVVARMIVDRPDLALELHDLIVEGGFVRAIFDPTTDTRTQARAALVCITPTGELASVLFEMHGDAPLPPLSALH